MAHDTSRLLHRIISLCKRRGFILQLPDKVSGREETFAYGPLGAELKKNIINEWWHAVVTSTSNVFPLDSNLLNTVTFPKSAAMGREVYQLANPHSKNSVPDHTSSVPSDLNKTSEINIVLDTPADTESKPTEEDVSLQKNSKLTEEELSLKFPDNDSLYLRPCIRQGGLSYFLSCAKSLDLRPPFGIAEVGRVFRVGIPSKQFIFHLQEFECMGLQFFIPPDEEREWYSHWQKKRLRWWRRLARNPEKFNLGEVEDEEEIKLQCAIEYEFPWGCHEVESIKNRGAKDLEQMATLGLGHESLLKCVKVKKEKTFPFLISLASGVDRAVLAYLCDAYNDLQRPSIHGSNGEGEQSLRPVLKLHVSLAPYKVAVLPTDETNQKLCMYCKMLTEELRHAGIATIYSETGQYESRLAEQDEVGTPYRIIADNKTLETGIVTLQERDTTGEEDMNGRDVLPSILKMLFGARIN